MIKVKLWFQKEQALIYNLYNINYIILIYDKIFAFKGDKKRKMPENDNFSFEMINYGINYII